MIKVLFILSLFFAWDIHAAAEIPVSKPPKRFMTTEERKAWRAGTYDSYVLARSSAKPVAVPSMAGFGSVDPEVTSVASSGETTLPGAPPFGPSPSKIEISPTRTAPPGDGQWWSGYVIPRRIISRSHPNDRFSGRNMMPDLEMDDLSTEMAKSVYALTFFISDTYAFNLASVYLNPTTPLIRDASLDKYLDRMTREGKPATLVIGCSHVSHRTFDDSIHLHKDCWVVNIEMPKEHHRKALGAEVLYVDEPMNITDPDFPREYINKFDNVLLERPNSGPLNNNNTWVNVLLAIKVGGVLWMEDGIGYGYRDDLMSFLQDKEDAPIITDPEAIRRKAELKTIYAKYPVDFYANPLGKTMLEKYGILPYEYSTKNRAPVRDIFPVTTFLTNAYCDDVANIHAASPFAAGRDSNFIIARKTESTQKLLEIKLAELAAHPA